jgi:hypothetical protein
MCCALVLLALVGPRLLLFFLWIFTPYVNRVFASILLPLLGLLFLPWTTLAYVWAVNVYGRVSGLGLFLVIIGLIADIASYGGGYSRRRRAEV